MIKIPCFSYMDDFHLLPVAVNHFIDGKHPVRHWHKHAFSELVFIIKGSAVHICDECSSPIRAGDVLLLHPGTVHAYEHDHKSLELFNVLYDPSRIIMPKLDIHQCAVFKKIFSESEQKNQECFSAKPIVHIPEDDLQEYRNILDNMIMESQSRSSGHVFSLMVDFMRLLLLLCRTASPADESAAGNENFSKAVKYIHEHYTEKIQIKDIALRANCSVRNLYRFFAQYAGCTPVEYILQMRLAKARDLLLYSQLNISEIAYRCGFNDGNYFSTKFHELTGITPGNFRKNPEKFYNIDIKR